MSEIVKLISEELGVISLNEIKKIKTKGKEIEIGLGKVVSDFVEKNYGILPTSTMEINNTSTNTTNLVEGKTHKIFENVLKMVNGSIPLFISGPAGSGKNFLIEQIAKGLDLKFYFSNAIKEEYNLNGFIDANGTYHETPFYKAFKTGGVFFLDEVDSSIPEALLILNAAIANGYFDFPIGKVEAHKDFRIICAGNTFGTGANAQYIGRNKLDASTLDRFVLVRMDYDLNLEKSIVKHLNKDESKYFKFVIRLRKYSTNNKWNIIFSTRTIINGYKLISLGLEIEEVFKMLLFKCNQSKVMMEELIKRNNENSLGTWTKGNPFYYGGEINEEYVKIVTKITKEL